MKNYIKLDTEPYWRESVENEIRQLRRQRGKDAAESMTNFAVFLVLLFIAFVAYSRGYLDNLDVLGSMNWLGEKIAFGANEVSNFLKNAALR